MADAVHGSRTTRLDAENPWPGPEAFRQEDAEYFFGRDRARDALTRLVLQYRLVLLYGRSGLGKTSLLRAGVFPRLEDALTLPIYVRLNHIGSPAAPPIELRLQIKAAIEAACARARVEAPALDPDATLWEWFYRADAQFFNERSRRVRPVLVFDQFEEAFTHGRATPELAATTERFLDQLIDLVRGSVPASVAAKLEQNAAGALDYAADRDACGVLLTIRQEFLAELLRLRPRLPSLVDHRFELSGMTLEDAESVVVGPGKHLIEPGVEKVIARFVAAARRNTDDQAADDTTVDPAILSIFCRELNNTRRERQLSRITTDLVAGVQQEIIADFYRRSTADLPPGVRVFIEEQLVTPSGFRNSVAWDQAVGEPGVEQAIDPLVDRRLIRIEGAPPRARIELTHDVLTEPIVQSRGIRRVQEANERAEQEREQRRLLKEDEDKRDRERRAFQIGILSALVLLLLLVVVGLLAWTTYKTKQIAEENLSFAHFEQGLALAATGRTDRGLAYIAQALRDNPGNASARSLAYDALLHLNWPLPQADVRHRGPIVSVQLDSGGVNAVSASSDGTARIWRLTDGGTIRELKHPAPVTTAAFGARDTMVLTVATDGRARRWDVSGGDPAMFEHPRDGEPDRPTIVAAAIAPGDGRIATGDIRGTMCIWSGTRPPVRIPAHPKKAIVQLEFNPAGTRIVTASFDHSAAVWDASNGRRLMQLKGHTDALQAARFSPDGRFVVTASRDGSAIIWDVHGVKPELRVRLPHDAAVVGADFSPDGTRIVTASEDRTARIWDALTGQQLGAVLTHDAPVTSAAFSPDGQRIVTVTAGQTALWTLDGAPAIEPIHFDLGAATSAAMSGDGRRLVTASMDGTATVWDVRRGAATPIGIPTPCSYSTTVRFTRAARQAVVMCRDSGTISMSIWDLAANLLSPSETNAAWTDFQTAALSPAAELLLVAGHDRATLARPGSPGILATWKSDSRVSEVAFSPDGRFAATAGDNGTIVWNAQTGAQVAVLAQGRRSSTVHFSGDGTRIVTTAAGADQDVVEVWDGRSGQRIGEALPTGARDGADARLSASGCCVAVSSAAGVKLFEAASGKLIAELDVPRIGAERVRVGFASSGDTLLTLGLFAQLWDGATGHLIAGLRDQSPTDGQFSADGGRALTTLTNGFRVWDARSGHPQSRLLGMDDIEGAQISPDGQRVATIARDGALRVWDVPTGTKQDALALASLLETIVGYRANARGAVAPIEDWPDALRSARAGASGDKTGVAAWALADREKRTIGPFTAITIDEYIDRQLAGGNADALREAQRLFPYNRRLSPAAPPAR